MQFVHVETCAQHQWQFSGYMYPQCVFQSNESHLEKSKKVVFFDEQDDLDSFRIALLKVEGISFFIQKRANAPVNDFTIWGDRDAAISNGLSIDDLVDGLLEVLGIESSNVVWRTDFKV